MGWTLMYRNLQITIYKAYSVFIRRVPPPPHMYELSLSIFLVNYVYMSCMYFAEGGFVIKYRVAIAHSLLISYNYKNQYNNSV